MQKTKIKYKHHHAMRRVVHRQWNVHHHDSAPTGTIYEQGKEQNAHHFSKQ
jgi:hypothetical protein